MRTVTFKSVLHGVALRMGLEPEENLQVNQAQAIVEYINTRIREAWEWADWPELVRTEERAFADNHDSTLTYTTGALVWDANGRAYYTAAQPVTAGILITNAAYWTPTATKDVPKLLPRTQPGKTDIGDVFNIWIRDPRAVANPGELDWWPEGDAFQVNTASPTIYVYFRTVPPTFTETPYSSTRAYVVGDLVYDAVTGECYKARLNNTGVGVASTTTWLKLDMPRVLSDAVKCAAYADTLREAGMNAQAAAEEGRYEAILVSEMDKVTAQAGRWPRWKAQIQ